MHASSVRNSILAAILSSTASASPFIAPRAGKYIRNELESFMHQFAELEANQCPVTETALDPWVSVDASGIPLATITPVLTTIDGVTSVINAAPPSLTATTTSTQGDSKATPISGTDVPTSTGGGSYLLCHNTDGDFAPFCKPDNGSEVYVGQTYYG
jgi:hypothetical protein